MRHISRSALVPYSSEQMFRLVDDIARYPEFLPWCSSAEVHKRLSESVEASIEMSTAGFKKSFRTRNTNQEFTNIQLELVDGPFRHLEGSWFFEQLGDAGSKVSLQIEFEFDNPVTDRMLGPFFEEICSKLISAFTERAAIIYPPKL